jgi:hypothetical protein
MPFKSTDLFARICGPTLSEAGITAAGGYYAKWLANFKALYPTRRSADGLVWSNANYYDRVKILYMMAEVTRNEGCRADARSLAISYRNYVLGSMGSNPFAPVPAEWAMPTGLALHYIDTGDAGSLKGLIGLGEWFAFPYYTNGFSDLAGEMDNRIQAYALRTWIRCWQLTNGGTRWAMLLRDNLPKILASQSADGAYRWQRIQGGNNKPFMVGLLNDSLIEYFEQFEADPRIPPSIKRAVGFMWDKNWIYIKEAFEYMDNQPASNDDGADLNNLIVNGFSFCGEMDKARTIFEAAVRLAYTGQSKQFNQHYTTAMRTVAMLNATQASAWEPVAPAPTPTPVPEPTPTPTPAPSNAALLEAKALLNEAKAKIDAATVKLG